MSAPQYSSYPTHSMQQGSSPQSMPGTPPVWRSSGPQPSYPGPGAPPQSPQRGGAPAGYGMPPGHHHPGASQTGQSPYMHPSQQHPGHPGAAAAAMSQDPYRHLQPQHPHQMQYRQVSTYKSEVIVHWIEGRGL